MSHIPKIELAPYLDIAKRRKWWVILPMFVALAAGWLHYYQSPKVYRSSTLILVEAQRVPSDFVPSTVTEDLQGRLKTISQQVHSRTNLEDIIHRFDLFPGQGEQEQEPGLAGKMKTKVLTFLGLMEASAVQNEDEEQDPSIQHLVSNVRSKINVNMEAKNQAFEISFEWGDPQVAAEVANALASQFIDRNLKVREEMAMGTTRFLDAEVQRLRQELQERENRLEDFKRRNMGRLPGQLESNLNILSQLKEELSRTEDRTEQVRQQMWLKEQQGQIQTENMFSDHADRDDAGSGQLQIEDLQEKLKEMLTVYKEQHPDIQRLKRRISQMEAQPEAVEEQGSQSELDSAYSGMDMQQVEQEQMRMRLAEYQDEMRKLREQIHEYEQRVEQTSEVELELKNLERDYEAVNDRFQNLLRRKLDAEMAEQMERRQQGEQFRIVDPAIAPDNPFKPDMNRVMVMALALGLGLGGGLAYLRESLDPAFYNPHEIESQLQVKTVISLPLVHEEKKRRRGRKT